MGDGGSEGRREGVRREGEGRRGEERGEGERAREETVYYLQFPASQCFFPAHEVLPHD